MSKLVRKKRFGAYAWVLEDTPEKVEQRPGVPEDLQSGTNSEDSSTEQEVM